MDKKPVSRPEGGKHPQPRPALLTPEQVEQAAGGLNPQPLPPGEARMCD